MKMPTLTTVSTGPTLFAFVFVSAGSSVLAYLVSVQFTIKNGIDPRAGILPFIIGIPLIHTWFFHGIATALTNLNLAITYLNQNKPVTELSIATCPPMLKPMAEQVNLLIRERADLKTMRGQLVTQISEAAAQEERNRLARDLHDSIKQQVFSMSISAAAAHAHLDTNPQAARAALQDVKQGAQEAMVEMRALLQQLSPAPLEKSGLIQALRDQCEALAYRTGATVTPNFSPTLPPDDRLPPGAQETIFRIAQEALSNIARHARAQHVNLSVEFTEEKQLTLRIADDGQGFDVSANPTGMGLSNIRSRSAAIGAHMEMTSAVGSGTTLTITIPLLTPLVITEEAIMYEQHEQQLKPISNLYTGFTGAMTAFILSFSLGAWRLIHQRETLADDPVSAVLMVIMSILVIVMPPVAIWTVTRANRLITPLLVSAGRGSRIHIKLQSTIRTAYLLVGLLSAWFLPMPWISGQANNWTPVIVALILLGLSAWDYRQMYRLSHLEVTHMPAKERLPEINRRLHELRLIWPTISAMFVVSLISGVLTGDRNVQFPPVETDDWMSIAFISIFLLLLLNQGISYFTYRRWKQQFGTQE